MSNISFNLTLQLLLINDHQIHSQWQTYGPYKYNTKTVIMTIIITATQAVSMLNNTRPSMTATMTFKRRYNSRLNRHIADAVSTAWRHSTRRQLNRVPTLTDTMHTAWSWHSVTVGPDADMANIISKARSWHSVTAGTGADTFADTMSTARSRHFAATWPRADIVADTVTDTMSTARSRHSATAGPGATDYVTTSSSAIARSVAEVP